MTIYYLLPVVFIAAGIAYTFMAQAKVRKAVAEGRGAQVFHDGWAGYFEGILPGENLIGVWMGQAYVKPNQTAGEIAGDLAKQAALGVIGMSTYTPSCYLGLTTLGRVLVSEEYSSMGKRGNFKVKTAFSPGTQLSSGAAAYPHPGAPPKNPYSANAPYELVRLMGPEGEYLAWLTSEGALTGASSFVSLTTVLPITAERAEGIWHSANLSMQATSATA
jgi:hypothetical protein